jgi:Neuraminidase (sialidase)
VFYLALASNGVSQQPCPVKWGLTSQISNTPASAFSPKLTVAGDTVHVVYHAGAVYYRRSTDAGRTWDVQTELVSADSMSASLLNRPLAVSGQTVSLVWANRNASGAITSIKLRRSTNGGADWLAPQVLVSNETLSPFRGPMVAAHGDYMYVSMTRFVSSQLQYFAVISSDRGVTWDSARQVTPVPESHGSGDIRASGIGVHVVFEREVAPSGREIAYLRSTDKGMTWSSEVVLSTIDTYQAWEPNVAADDSGNVYVSWQDAKYGTIGGFTGTVLLRKSTNNGSTWLSEVRVSNFPSAERSSLAIDNTVVHVVWDDERGGVVNRTIQYRGSTDGGLAWCPEVTIGDTLDVLTGGAVCSCSGIVHTSYSSYPQSGGNAFVYYRQGTVLTSTVEGHKGLPEKFTVSALYPNPFNPTTNVQYALPSDGKLTIAVFDNLGRQVALVLDDLQGSGTYRFNLDGSRWASGVYYVVVRFNTKQIVREVVLMR